MFPTATNLQLIFLFSRSITAHSPLIGSGMNANAEDCSATDSCGMGFGVEGSSFFGI